jgi:hypothetical protein
MPAVGILGARQVGKTTLAKLVAKEYEQTVEWFDLESPEDHARLSDPMLALRSARGLVVIDEIQRQPDLFQTIRVLIDREEKRRFLLLGSASPELLRQTSESLAGRIAYHQLGGFHCDEIEPRKWNRLWIRGGFPRSFLAPDEESSMVWRRSFVRTFLERDLAELGVRIPSTTLRRFWTMLAHYHGQVWNASEFARSFGVADTTVRGYLDTLTDALVVRQLQPWYENLSKRQVKSPKVYIIDSGLVHSLLSLRGEEEVESHPKVGASWEGFIIEQLLHLLGAAPEECYFWATHAGAELDLLIVRGTTRRGFEIKRTTTPRVTPSMRSALNDLGLDSIDVVHAGESSFPLTEQIRAVSYQRILADIKPLK